MACGGAIFAPMSKDRSTESLLQDHLEIVTAALARCVREAEPDPNDEYGTRRNTELSNAAALLKASARLGFALAKLKGEFRHAISVSRSDGAGGRDAEIGRGTPSQN